jgi:FMN reductase [NAD(P)H]
MPGHNSEDGSPDNSHANSTIRLLHERASVRSFEDRPIPDRILHDILRAGVHAPTGGNLQPYSIIKISDSTIKERLGEMCQQEFIGRAPVDLLFCLDFHRLQRWAGLEIAPFSATSSFRHFWIGFQDTIITAQNICTAADALGLGSVYIGTVLEFVRDLREMFELPEGVLPVVLLCLGYPKYRPQPKRKLPVPVVVHDGHYRELSDDKLQLAYEAKYPVRDRPEVQMEATPEPLAKIEQTCRAVHGDAFAARCLRYIGDIGYIPIAHRYFGLHYRANEMPVGNDEFLQTIREAGFGWFDKWQPHRDQASPPDD